MLIQTPEVLPKQDCKYYIFYLSCSWPDGVHLFYLLPQKDTQYLWFDLNFLSLSTGCNSYHMIVHMHDISY